MTWFFISASLVTGICGRKTAHSFDPVVYRNGVGHGVDISSGRTGLLAPIRVSVARAHRSHPQALWRSALLVTVDAGKTGTQTSHPVWLTLNRQATSRVQQQSAATTARETERLRPL
jgi:hypothetical protein